MVASARVMYIEGFSGVAGDMLLAALIDVGLPVAALQAALGTLGVDHDLVVSRTTRAGVSAARVEVRERSGSGAGAQAHTHAGPSDGDSRDHEHGHSHAGQIPHSHHHDQHAHRSFSEIAHLIGHSALSPAARDRAVGLVRRIAEAEAAIHDRPLEEVHLHEVGATDSIIDIVGVVFGMEWLGIDEVVASPLNVGGGTVAIAHGRYPVPAPATLRLLAGVPVYNGGPDVELVTPTGALLVSGYAGSYGRMPRMTVDRVGYGAGTRDFIDRPNVVRLVIGERVAGSPDAALGDPTGMPAETVVKVECEIDDMNPQLFEPASEQLRAVGALDVFFTSVQMKKGRPGTLVTVIAPVDREDAIIEALFRHTTTIGARYERMRRRVLERRWEEVTTSGGPVRIKVSGRGDEVLNAAPEFEDCVRIARTTGRPLKDVQAEAMDAWRSTPRAR